MIPVTPAPAPDDFEHRVKNPGLDAIRELVGEIPIKKRRGPKRKKIADRREDIPPEFFPPFWREVIPDMLIAYHRMCAYLALYIEPATGAPSVDHVNPKSRAWDQVYEWTNYRLACSLMNSRKNADPVLDPFEISDGLFALEFVGFQVIPGPQAIGVLKNEVINTITTLGLSSEECCKARRAYVEEYQGGHIDLDYLQRRAPFVAIEMRRQGLL